MVLDATMRIFRDEGFDLSELDEKVIAIKPQDKKIGFSLFGRKSLGSN